MDKLKIETVKKKIHREAMNSQVHKILFYKSEIWFSHIFFPISLPDEQKNAIFCPQTLLEKEGNCLDNRNCHKLSPEREEWSEKISTP